MKKLFFHHPVFRLIAPVVFGLMVYLIILLLNNNVGQISTLFTSEEVYVCIGLALLFTESFRISLLLSQRLESKLLYINPLLIQLVASTIATIILISGGLFAYFYYSIGYTPSIIDYQIFGGIFVFFNFLLNLMYFSLYYSGKENTLKVDIEQKKTEGVLLELQDYKNDINPTLLYQSLEKLIVLVHDNTDKAEELIDNLSSVYRYILGHKQMEVVEMTTELMAVNHLLSLLNEVHGGNIYLDIEEDDLLHQQIVPGTMVSLIEQIVRNTIITHHSPLTISIVQNSDDYLEIKHKLRDRLVSNKEEGKTLLDAIQRSYNYFSDKPLVHVKAYDESFYKIPALSFEEESVLVS